VVAPLDGLAAGLHAVDDGIRVIVRALTATTNAAHAVRLVAWFLLRHPSSWLLGYVLTLGCALPATAIMAQIVGAAADGYPAALGRGALDVDWWTRLRQQDAALSGDFSPRTLGFAAALDNLSALLDGPESHAWVIVITAVVSAATWAALWSVVLTRLAAARDVGAAGAWRAVRRFVAPMMSISATAGLVAVFLYLVIQPLLMDRLFAVATGQADSREAFITRASLYTVFGVALLVVSVTADVARAHVVLTDGRNFAHNLAAALRMVFTSAGPVTLVCGVLLALHAIVLTGYGVGEVLGGARVGGWRAVAAAQLYVALRIGLRLLWGGALFVLTQQKLRAASR
jgi:hypothetical protein